MERRPPSSRTASRLSGVLLLALAGCASTSPDAGFRAVSDQVKQRTGHPIAWTRDAPEDPEITRRIHDALQRPLTVDDAVRIALLRNRSLAATYEDLSLSQADVVQAGLLANPTFGAGMTVAEGDRLSPNLTLGVTWNFLDLLLLPAKKKIAGAQFEATKRRVADAVLDLSAQVQRAYYELTAAQAIAAMRQIVADAGEAAAGLATEQSEAGNISALDLEDQRAASQQLALDRLRAQADVVTARERLTSLLGLWGPDATVQAPDRLPEIPANGPSLDALEALAIASRLDLDAMRSEREALGRTLSLVRSTRYTPGIGVGLEGGRLRDGNIALAPSAELELPIFDQKQATIARVEALVRTADDRLQARGVEIRAEVRAARERMVVAERAATLYRTRVVPQRERMVALSQRQYDAMLLGVFQLLSARQSEVSAYRECFEATRDYWVARVDLERAVGGRLPMPAVVPAPSPSSP